MSNGAKTNWEMGFDPVEGRLTDLSRSPAITTSHDAAWPSDLSLHSIVLHEPDDFLANSASARRIGKSKINFKGHETRD